MDDFARHYQLLGLEAGASPEQVRQAYRDLVKVWHPDRFGHDERLRLIAQNKLKEINGAYESLKAQAFEAALTSEPAAAPEAETVSAPPMARSRATLWISVGALVVVLGATAAFLMSTKEAGKTPMASTNTTATIITSSPPASSGRGALSFHRNQSHLEIMTTGSLTGVFTVECWVLNHRPKQGGTIVSSRVPDDFGFDIKFRQAKRFHADIGDGSQWLAKMANARFAYQGDTWYHIAYVVKPDHYSIYVNGKLQESGEISPSGNPVLYDATHHLCFGMDGRDPDDLDGSIAEIQIWRTARSQTQIESGMNETLTGDEPGLQGCWRFTEGSGVITADDSGHGFTGKLVGNVSWTKMPHP